MNKKVMMDKPVTKAEMDEAFRKFKVEQRGEFKSIMEQFRSDIFTRFDQVMGELEQIREDHLFMDHDIKNLKATDDNHEKRIKKLEERVN